MQNNFIISSKNPLCTVLWWRIKSKNKSILSSIHSNNIIAHSHINFQVFFRNLLLQFLLRHSCLQTASSILDGINCI